VHRRGVHRGDAKRGGKADALREPTHAGAFYTLVPIRPRRRGERRSLRTFAVVSLLPPLAFIPRHRRLSTPTDAYELHPDIRLYGMALQFMDREPIYHDHIPPPSSGHGFYDPEETMTLRWNSRVGVAYIDGAHVTVRLLPVRPRSRVDRRFLRSSFFPFARYVMNLTFVLTRVKYIHQ